LERADIRFGKPKLRRIGQDFVQLGKHVYEDDPRVRVVLSESSHVINKAAVPSNDGLTEPCPRGVACANERLGQRILIPPLTFHHDGTRSAAVQTADHIRIGQNVGTNARIPSRFVKPVRWQSAGLVRIERWSLKDLSRATRRLREYGNLPRRRASTAGGAATQAFATVEMIECNRPKAFKATRVEIVLEPGENS
jgi:hypothetical protein